mmetsp:Transcript_12330/g.16149  ORF Transcript_12330/g.16149 Transcript_12330/m.16149 type:complete len:584 (-) Transcript_12330:469-2220(-)|eukprot:CAMPEP_0198152658 /NCGR_PEP_ID=MMETSP1443-20131203/60738_1 /TAXON_ID=186043 /ORGANISM="Entomoneis sp., Strain CCMP2396" /LENGTH=583 /DNA_ID=CAMNT_0043818753 /DNA_START=42 /DNA_END=1793 /DNA_ORIENTATION=-
MLHHYLVNSAAATSRRRFGVSSCQLLSVISRNDRRRHRSGEYYNHYSSSSTVCDQKRKKVVIVGSGPSGCYTAKYLKAAWDKSVLSQDDDDSQSLQNQIDVIERLPTPYGLVRYGVAPDHPEVKNVQNDFHALFDKNKNKPKNGISYFGNVQVGRDVSLQELRQMYDAVVLATGCESDRRLNLPLEQDLTGILSAREFVAWYNGHPDFEHIGEQVKAALGSSGGGSGGGGLQSDNVQDGHDGDGDDDDTVRDVSVVIVGQGNVALDCARVLAKGGAGLYDTDIASRTLPILGKGVARVTVVGRRGHIQGAFTIKELRELVQLDDEGHDTCFVVRTDELEMGATEASLQELEGPGGRPKKRIDKLLRKASGKTPDSASKRIDLRFLMSPSVWEPDEKDPSRLGSLVCERTRLEGELGKQNAVGTGEMERIPAQLALLSIGYKGVPIPGLDEEKYFDTDRGVVKHEHGRMEGPSVNMGGLYAAGWVKRGPSGIIGTNIPDARETVNTILHDLQSNETIRDDDDNVNNQDSNNGDLKTLLEERGVQVVDWSAYQRLEEKEEASKRSESQPREKITDLQKQIEAALA